MNSVSLIGRLTRDPELRYAAGSQMAITRFSIAIDRPVRQGEERKTDFPNIVVFGKQAENCEKYLAKGRMVGVTGRIQTGSYKNRDGATVYTTEVVADRVEFIDWGDRNGSERSGSGSSYDGGYSTRQNTSQSYAPQGSSRSEYEEEMPDSFQTIDEDVPF